MVLLVTGVAGFIGSNFIDYYLNKYNDRKIIGIDNLTYAGNMKNLITDDKFKFLKGDISDKKFINNLFIRNDIEGIINFAAETHVDNSIRYPDIFIKSNINGVFNLIECARQNLFNKNEWKDDFRYIQISTDEVYGEIIGSEKFTELSSIHPNNPYSASKASGDLFVQSYYNTYNFPGIISRCSNNYGPKQHKEKLIPMVIKNAINHKPIPIYGDGLQVRDWLYVKDHCIAIDCILNRGRIGEIYNIGGNNEILNKELVISILSILREITNDKKIDTLLMANVSDRPGHDRRYAIDATKIQNELGWNPTTSFENGIRKTIDWYLKFFDKYT